VAAASAHGVGRDRFWHEGFRDNKAVITGTITSVGTGSFGANAYAVTPGAGNASATPATAPVTITVGSATKVVTAGQSGLTVGDTFYAVYTGVSDSTPLSTLAGDTPAAIYAFMAPTPEVVVKGIVTTAPASGSDSFSATTFVVTPLHFMGGGGAFKPGTSFKGGSYTYGGHVGGSYGFDPASADSRGGHRGRSAHCDSGSADASVVGTPNTTITTDANTQVVINHQASSVSNLAVGDKFVAIYHGTPSEPLSTITATPAISIKAETGPAGKALYGFVGTVASTGSGTLTVNVTGSFPQGMFSGADTFAVGSQTKVFGNTNLAPGDVVAGGILAPTGASASTIGSTPLQLLVNYTPATSSPGTTTADQVRRAERRAIEMLRREAGLARHGHKYETHRK
jgi:hypothetical protein